MKKVNRVLILFLSVILLVSCSQVADRPDAKKAALLAAKEYCEKNLVKEGLTYTLGDTDSCVVQGNEAFVKIKVKVTANGKEEKKTISAGCEQDKEKNWKVTSISME